MAYPQLLNQPCASFSVINNKASRKAFSNSSRVLALAVRKYVLIFDQHFSIGFKSGE